jgi:hypothetical protein
MLIQTPYPSRRPGCFFFVLVVKDAIRSVFRADNDKKGFSFKNKMGVFRGAFK